MIELWRDKQQLDGTPGQILFNCTFICCSLERPWENNIQNVSCIPVGIYPIKMTFSPRFQKQTLQILDVPGRWGIRIHSANLVSQLRGCIAPCERIRETKEGELYGEESRSATLYLEEIVEKYRIKEISILQD